LHFNDDHKSMSRPEEKKRTGQQHRSEKEGDKRDDKRDVKKDEKKHGSDCGCFMDDDMQDYDNGGASTVRRRSTSTPRALRSKPPMNPHSRWRYADVASYARAVARKLGEPTYVLNRPGGAAVWNRPRGTCFRKVAVTDEHVLHGSAAPSTMATAAAAAAPPPHYDVVSVSVDCAVPRDFWVPLMSTMPFVVTDQLKRTVTCRCASIEMCVAALDVLTRAIVNRTPGLMSQLGSWVASLRDRVQYAQMYNDLCRNLTVLSATVAAPATVVTAAPLTAATAAALTAATKESIRK
jgi:hypothetical protein